MFTAEEIDKVVKEGGYEVDDFITFEGIERLVNVAQNAGILDDRLSVFRIDDDSANFIICFNLDRLNVPRGLRLASSPIDGRSILGKDDSLDGVRNRIFRVLYRITIEMNILKNTYQKLTGFTA